MGCLLPLSMGQVLPSRRSVMRHFVVAPVAAAIHGQETPMRRSPFPAVPPLVLLLLARFPAPASAHRDDYIDETFVYMTLARNEFELELWGEGRSSEDRASSYWYTSAFEYGITSRWTIDGAGQWTQDRDPLRFGRLRLETRCRFSEEGRLPVDLAASAEYEREHPGSTGDYEQTLTPRIVVSRDLMRRFNTTLNLDFPIALPDGDHVSFAWALGARYPDEGFARYGVELKQHASEHQAVAFPQIWFALPREMTLKFGVGIGLTPQTDPVVARAVFEAEF